MVSPLTSQESEELKAYIDETQLRRSPGTLNVAALAVTRSPFQSIAPAGDGGDSKDELSESDRSTNSEERSSSPVVLNSRFMRDSHQRQAHDS